MKQVRRVYVLICKLKNKCVKVEYWKWNSVLLTERRIYYHYSPHMLHLAMLTSAHYSVRPIWPSLTMVIILQAHDFYAHVPHFPNSSTDQSDTPPNHSVTPISGGRAMSHVGFLLRILINSQFPRRNPNKSSSRLGYFPNSA